VRSFGYLPDAPDERDAKLSARLGALAESPPPPSESVLHPSVGPKDQESTSSCTGQSGAQAALLAYLRAGVACPELSALFPYFMGRAEYGGQSTDDGSYLRAVIKAIVRLGIPPESAWPMIAARVNVQPEPNAYRQAYDRKGVRGYHRIESGDVDGVRRAIAAGFPVIGGWQVGEDFVNWNGQGVISGQPRIVGGHAMVIGAYESDGTFKLLNSWGWGWGRGGYAVVDEMFIAAVQDAWAVDVVAP
jgi:hypothetical protein